MPTLIICRNDSGLIPGCFSGEEARQTEKEIPPIHPGEILQGEFLEPMGISQYRLAKGIGVSAMRASEIARGKRSISA